MKEVHGAGLGIAAVELEGAAGVAVVTHASAIDQVTNGIDRAGVDRGKGDTHQHIVKGIAPDAHIACLAVCFHAVVTRAKDQILIHVCLIGLALACCLRGAHAKAVKSI